MQNWSYVWKSKILTEKFVGCRKKYPKTTNFWAHELAIGLKGE